MKHKKKTAPRQGLLALGKRSYLLYLWYRLRRGGLRDTYQRAMQLLRPALFWRRVGLWTLRILIALQSGTLLLLLVTASAILFPVACLLSLLASLSLSLLCRRAAAELAPRLRGQRLALLESDACRMASLLVSLHYTVLLPDHEMPRRTLTYFRLSEGVFAIRPSFYYYLKRKGFLSPSRALILL